jgi:phage terminase small subunit
MSGSNPETELNDMHQAFVDAYLENGFNATQAAVAAGYSPRSARTSGSRQLARPDVQRAIRRAMGMTMPGRIKCRLAEIAFADIADLERILSTRMPLSDLRELGVPTAMIRDLRIRRAQAPRDPDAIPMEVVEVKLHDSLKALQELARVYSLGLERVQVEHVAGDDMPTRDDLQGLMARLDAGLGATEGPVAAPGGDEGDEAGPDEASDDD